MDPEYTILIKGLKAMVVLLLLLINIMILKMNYLLILFMINKPKINRQAFKNLWALNIK